MHSIATWLARAGLACICMLGGAGAANAVNQLSPLKVGIWAGGAFSADGSNVFQECAAATKNSSGTTMMFAISNTFQWTLSFSDPSWKQQTGLKFPMTFSIDGKTSWQSTAFVGNSTLIVVPLAVTPSLMQTLMHGEVLRVTAAGQAYNVPLTNTVAMLPALQSCAEKYVGQQNAANPFAAAGQTAAAPPQSNNAAAAGQSCINDLVASNFSGAVTDCTQAIALNSSDEGAYVNRCLAFGSQGGFSSAVADCTKGISLNPNDWKAYATRCYAYLGLNDNAAAVTDCTQAIALNSKDPSAYDYRCQAYDGSGNYAAAIADCTQAIALDPKYPAPYNDRGIADAKQANYAAAIADFSQFIVLDPGVARAYVNRGEAYEKAGQSAQAIADYQKALTLDSSNQAAKSGLSRLGGAPASVALASPAAAAPANSACFAIPDFFMIQANDNTDTAGINDSDLNARSIKLDCTLSISDWGSVSFASSNLCPGASVTIPTAKKQCKVLSLTPITIDPANYTSIYVRTTLVQGGQ